MTDLAIRTNTTTDLEKWLLNASQTHQVATGLAKTSFVPKSMQGRPEEITAAILAGQELGLDPMAALRSIDIIDGTPALRALTLRGLVQSRGHRIWVDETTPTRAVVKGQRRGEQQIEQSVWTIERARTAGLSSKKNWQNNPTAMLIARATAEVARLIAADAILGMPYTVEEIRDGVDIDSDPSAPEPVKPKLRAMRRHAWQRADEQAGVPAPELEPAPDVAPHELEARADTDWPETPDLPDAS